MSLNGVKLGLNEEFYEFYAPQGRIWRLRLWVNLLIVNAFIKTIVLQLW